MRCRGRIATACAHTFVTGGIANHLARAGLQGRKERDRARSLFHAAEDKAELLQELRDAGRIPNRLLPAVPSLLAEWASVRPVMHGREGETLVPTPYRGTGSMFSRSFSAFAGFNALSQIC